MGASSKLMSGAAAAHPCFCSFSTAAASAESTSQARICNASSFPVGRVAAVGGICCLDGRVNSIGGESRSLDRLSISAASEIEGARRSTQGRSCIGSNLSPVPVRHRRMSTLSCFRAATFELVSCYNRFFAEEIQKQRKGGRRRRQRTIVKALQDDSDYEREEQSWMREEQRWLREEQRWLREEQRWRRDEAFWIQANQALQDEVTALKTEVEELRGTRGSGGEITDVTLRNLVGGMRHLLQALAVPGSEDFPLVDSPKQIPGNVSFSGGTSTTYVVEESEAIVSPVTFVASPEKFIAVVTPETSSGATPEAKPPTPAPPPSKSSQSSNGATSNSPTTTTASKRILKSGMEGDDVKQLHDALSELGFYSGEEDIEFSVFSDGTDSAVKTWQSTRGFSEDGKVTKDMMGALLAEVAATISTKEGGEKKVTKPNSQPSTKTETTLKTKQFTPETKQPASNDHLREREIDKYERSNAQETGTGSSRRVYLLGENRWEEPGRLQKRQDEERRIKANEHTPKMKLGHELCFQCRGVKTMLCTDCEGTGDLNVEEQFLEWVEEGSAKCPYCEGTGAIPCDVCHGLSVQAQN